MRLFLLSFFCLISQFLVADSEIDSLLQLAQNEKVDTIQIRHYITLSEICEIDDIPIYADKTIELSDLAISNYRNKNDIQKVQVLKGKGLINKGFYENEIGKIEESKLKYEEALNIFLEADAKNEVVGALINLGYVYNHNNDPFLALEYYQRANELAREIDDKFMEGVTYLNMGYIYMNAGDVEKALEVEFKGLKIREETGDIDGIARASTHIAQIYSSQGDYEKALELEFKSLELRKQKGDNIDIGYALNNIATTYGKMGDTLKSHEYYKLAYETRMQTNSPRSKAFGCDAMARVLAEQGNFSEGLDLLNESIEIWKSLNDHSGLSNAYFNAALIYGLYSKDYDKAIEFGKKSLELALEINEIEAVMFASDALTNSFKKVGNYKSALEMKELYISMRDSLSNEKNQKAAIKKQTQYEFEKAQLLADQQRNDELRIEKEKLQRRDNLQYSLIFLGILLLFGIILGFGFIKVSPTVAEGIIFFAFLILFEFLLVLGDPYVESITGGEPIYKLLANAVLAGAIFPAHAFFERALKSRIVKQ